MLKIGHRLTIAGFLLAASSFGVAAPVTCASSNPLQLRTLTVDPALVGGVCATQLGNFNPAAAVSTIATATGLAAIHLDKDNPGNPVSGDDLQEAWLGLTTATSGLQGGWTVDEAAWNGYQRLFLGFHFGNGGSSAASNPDSFFVELARSDNAGTWLLGGTGAALNALSHIDLIGAGTNQVPEPATLALVGLGLLAAASGMRRRRV